ncbi:hypothetical protein L1887_56435 [Cichorium endivia]|nr:hypothetical protein L1887_56435 [Cichorium endivia]
MEWRAPLFQQRRAKELHGYCVGASQSVKGRKGLIIHQHQLSNDGDGDGLQSCSREEEGAARKKQGNRGGETKGGKRSLFEQQRQMLLVSSDAGSQRGSTARLKLPPHWQQQEDRLSLDPRDRISPAERPQSQQSQQSQQSRTLDLRPESRWGEMRAVKVQVAAGRDPNQPITLPRSSISAATLAAQTPALSPRCSLLQSSLVGRRLENFPFLPSHRQPGLRPPPALLSLRPPPTPGRPLAPGSGRRPFSPKLPITSVLVDGPYRSLLPPCPKHRSRSPNGRGNSRSSMSPKSKSPSCFRRRSPRSAAPLSSSGGNATRRANPRRTRTRLARLE